MLSCTATDHVGPFVIGTLYLKPKRLFRASGPSDAVGQPPVFHPESSFAGASAHQCATPDAPPSDTSTSSYTSVSR